MTATPAKKIHGSFRFTRAADGRTVGFDSSPDYTLAQKFGYDAKTMRYEESGSTADHHRWNVYAGHTGTVKPPLAGVLTQKTTATIRRELSQH